MQLDKIFSTQFLDATTGNPLTGLSATITILEISESDGTTTATPINNVACIEGGSGFYRYFFSAMSSDKIYEYFINPNSSSAVISSGWVDKRQNYLDKPLSAIIGSFNVGGKSSQYDFGMQDRKNLEELTKLKELIETKISETNSHIELAKEETIGKIESIEIPEAKLEEKEAKKVLKLVTSVDKKLTSYIESEMKEKDDIKEISSEFLQLEKEEREREIKEREEKKLQEIEDKKREEEEKKMEAERDAKLLEELQAEFDKSDEEDKLEKKKELEAEIKEMEKEMKEKEKELNSIK